MTRLTRHTAETCRWSAPGVRRNPLSDDDDEFEGCWLCERTGVSIPVTRAECAICTHWSPDRERSRATRVRGSLNRN